MSRFAMLAAVLGTASVLAAGCFDMSMDFTVHEDESASMRVLVAADTDALALAAAADPSVDSVIDACNVTVGQIVGNAEAPANLSPVGLPDAPEPDAADEADGSASSENYVEWINDGETCSYVGSQQASAEALALALAESTEDPQVLARTEAGGWRFSIEIPVAGSPDDLPENAAALDLMLGAFRLNVELPGHPVDHNADEASTLATGDSANTTFVWSIPFSALAGAEAPFAETTPEEPLPAIVERLAKADKHLSVETSPASSAPPTSLGIPDADDSENGGIGAGSVAILVLFVLVAAAALWSYWSRESKGPSEV